MTLNANELAGCAAGAETIRCACCTGSADWSSSHAEDIESLRKYETQRRAVDAEFDARLRARGL